MEFIIDRSKWRCGWDGDYAKGKGVTVLLNNEGFMCCLGQISEQLGVPKSDLEKEGEPEDISIKHLNKLENILVVYDDDEGVTFNNTLSKKAIGINDNGSTTLKEKENKLKELFKEYGHTIKFIGKSVKYTGI